MIGILILLLITLATALVSLYVWVPFIPTPKKVAKRMVELAELKGNEVVYDLGCGDARLLIEAKKRYPGITAIGYELPIGVWMLAKLRVFLSHQKVEVHLKDFRKADFSNADTLLLYLIPEAMKPLRDKLDRELKKGATVISHGFAIPEKDHVHVERCILPAWHFIRPPRQEGPRIFVYKW